LVALALGLSPAVTEAAGLGRLTVRSAIGQPLRADIELVSVGPDEVSSLAARVAPPEAYRNAKVQFNPALLGARATIERRPGGTAYIRVTSNRPVEEPYIDLLVELTWNTGRLVREYTALIDPPGFGSTQTAAPTALPQVHPASAVSIVTPTAAPARPVAARPADTAPRNYTVQPGDTLNKIATGVKPEGVSLEQALIGIYRSNRDAYINDNMNLLRSGQ
jgi:pilus assembly protein FimV